MSAKQDELRRLRIARSSTESELKSAARRGRNIAHYQYDLMLLDECIEKLEDDEDDED
jgi:hypothetical protein